MKEKKYTWVWCYEDYPSMNQADTLMEIINDVLNGPQLSVSKKEGREPVIESKNGIITIAWHSDDDDGILVLNKFSIHENPFEVTKFLNEIYKNANADHHFNIIENK